MRKIKAIVLAAGKSTRMNSGFSKVLHKIYGKPMIHYVLDSLRDVRIHRIIIITNGSDEIKENCSAYKNIEYAAQRKLLGTGHAVAQAKKALTKLDGDVLVLYGDMPLLTAHTLQRLIDKHKGSLAACTLLTTRLRNPNGYGRIVRDVDDRIMKIVEEQDASLYERAIEEVNVGVYCFRIKELFKAIDRVSADNRKGEYYLTDVIHILRKEGLGIESIQTDDFEEAIGVNSRQNLAQAQEFAKNRILDRMMASGVGIIDPNTTHIYNDVTIGQDTIIYPFTVIESNVTVGKKCKIGPFSRIRPDTEIHNEVEVGNFVEIVRSTVGEKSKIRHHAFLGDATIGKNVNIGAGTITANYEKNKVNKTRIADNAFIGSGTVIVAPASVGKGVVTGAGSVVTKGTVAAGSVVFGVPAKAYTKNHTKRARS
jgi:bifunctional UDP-N-acetylglucosamine pyrophosphorylase/glucosamine-1-phosphate N-acetyltransferase